MKAASDELTKAEVEAAHLGDRRAEAERELAAIAERLGEEVPPAEQALSEEERAEIDRRLERLERRRAQIGPVNPLAEREYDEAREHVEALQAQREDTERAMRELETLIRDIDERDRARLRADLRGDREELRGDGRAPLPGRPRRPAPGQPAAGPRRGAARPASRRRRATTPSPSPRRRKRSARSSGSRSRSPRPASRPASSRCSPAARSRWSRWPSSSPSSSPGPAPSTSSTRSRPPSTTPTSTASCS